MSDSGETHTTPISEDRPVVEGQESEVPSTASMHSKPPEPVTVPPEPCLEPRPPVDGAPDTEEAKPQPAQDKEQLQPDVPKTVAPGPASRPGIPGHIHGTGMTGPRISPLAQSQFKHPGMPASRMQGGQPGKTPEQLEEAKLRSKYGKLNKPGGSDFLRMRLNKGGQKYFDSGDYNMAKSKGKIGLRATPQIVTKPGLPRPVEATTGDTIPTPASIHHRKSSAEISKLAV